MAVDPRELLRWRSVRRRYDLSESMFAALVGVSRSTYRDWERGTSTPSSSQLARVCAEVRRLESVSPDVRGESRRVGRPVGS